MPTNDQGSSDIEQGLGHPDPGGGTAESAIKDESTSQIILRLVALAEGNKETSEKYKSFKKKYKDLDTKVKKIIRDVKKTKDSQIRTIEIVSIFVAFITFVSTEGKLFEKIGSLPEVISFTLILLGCLLTFLVVSHFIVRNIFFDDSAEDKFAKRQIKFLLTLLIVSLLLIGSGIFFGYKTGFFKNVNGNTETQPQKEIPLNEIPGPVKQQKTNIKNGGD